MKLANTLKFITKQQTLSYGLISNFVSFDQVPSLATRVSSSNLSSGKPSSPRPLGSTMIGSAHRGSSSTLVSSNPSSPGPLTSPSYSHAYGGHLAGSPTPMNHRNSPVSPPPPPPKPGKLVSCFSRL